MNKFGCILTVLWLVLVAALVCWKWETVHGLSLNAWGDFFAGAFAPPAFVWLVYGYFLQRNELNQNTGALLQQAEEMKAMVHEVREAVKVSHENNILAQRNARTALELTRSKRDGR